MYRVLFVGLGGFLGASGRFLVSEGVQSLTGARFPYGTLAVNVVGSFLLALLAVLMVRSGGSTVGWELFLLTGVLGAFTTFSTFSHESLLLLRDGLYWGFAGNVIGNVVLCLLAALAGSGLAVYSIG